MRSDAGGGIGGTVANQSNCSLRRVDVSSCRFAMLLNRSAWGQPAVYSDQPFVQNSRTTTEGTEGTGHPTGGVEVNEKTHPSELPAGPLNCRHPVRRIRRAIEEFFNGVLLCELDPRGRARGCEIESDGFPLMFYIQLSSC